MEEKHLETHGEVIHPALSSVVYLSGGSAAAGSVVYSCIRCDSKFNVTVPLEY
jgi:hypothetical protein